MWQLQWDFPGRLGDIQDNLICQINKISIVEGVLDEIQVAFRPLRSCQDQIFCLRQAFNLLNKYGIQGNLLEAITSIYVGSKAEVRIDGEISDCLNVKEVDP